MAEQKAIRGNMLPPGGVTATTEAGQGLPLLPDTLTLQRMSEAFMERSEYNCIQLNKVTLTPQQQKSFIINNVGLGESLELFVEGSISLVNTAATAQDVNISPDFPYNLLSNILVQFNGQTVITNLSGYEALGIMAKRYKGVLIGLQASAGSKKNDQLKCRVATGIAYVEAGANVTLTQGDGLTGVTKATVAANSTGVLNFGFYLQIPFTLRQDLLLGLIPMQNNSVYASVTLTVPALLGANAGSPLYVSGGVPSTLTATANITCQPTYNFWSIPMPNNPQLYAFLVSHSYMLLSQANNPINKTGAEALQYLLPNNYYLLSLLLTIRDSNNALVNVAQMVDNPFLSYNGTARVDRRDINTRMARQIIFYEGVPVPLGQLLWDGTDISYLTNGTNTTKWLNMYLANNPMFVADVASGFALPGSFSVLREQLVPANVQIV